MGNRDITQETIQSPLYRIWGIGTEMISELFMRSAQWMTHSLTVAQGLAMERLAEQRQSTRNVVWDYSWVQSSLYPFRRISTEKISGIIYMSDSG